MCDLLQLDQEARAMLVNHYGNHLRHWSNILFSLAIAFFTIVQAKKEITPEVFRFLLSVLMSVGVQTIIRIFYYGQAIGIVPSLGLERDKQSQKRYQSYFGQLDSDLVLKLRKGYCRLGRYLWSLTKMKVCVPFTITLTLSLWTNWDNILSEIPNLRLSFLTASARMIGLFFSITPQDIGFYLLLAVIWTCALPLIDVDGDGRSGRISGPFLQKVKSWFDPRNK